MENKVTDSDINSICLFVCPTITQWAMMADTICETSLLHNGNILYIYSYTQRNVKIIHNMSNLTIRLNLSKKPNSLEEKNLSYPMILSFSVYYFYVNTILFHLEKIFFLQVNHYGNHIFRMSLGHKRLYIIFWEHIMQVSFQSQAWVDQFHSQIGCGIVKLTPGLESYR